MERVLLACRRMSVRLTADRKRFTLLCMLTAVALVFWTKLILVDRPGTVAMAETQGDEAIVQPIIDMPKDPVRVILPEKPERNPFSVSAAHFPVAKESALALGNAPKSTPQTSDLKAEAASRLRLGATLPPHAAVINGVTYRLGQFLLETGEHVFELVDVHQHQAVLDAQGRRFVLRLDKGSTR